MSALAGAASKGAALAILLLVATSGTGPLLRAQSLPTATLAGKVTTENGMPLPGIRILLESKSLQGVREFSTSATGDFLAALLPAGDYTVTFGAEGMQTVSRSVTLHAASAVRLDQRMQPAGVSESAIIAADAASVSALANPEIEANYKKQLIDRLPVNRSLRSIVLLAPGVTDNGPHGNVGTTNDRKALMISGALSYSNVFLIDGAVVNENLRGQPYDLFIEDAIEETTIKTGSISAEYGRFTGGVVSAITRSGSNAFKGSFRATLNNNQWTANNPFDAALGRDNRADHVAASYEETLGGPVWKDRIWFFAAGRQADLSDPRETRLVPRVVNGDVDPTPTAYVYASGERRLEGKLTASAAPGFGIVASYIDVNFDEANTTLNTDFLLDTAGLFSRKASYSLFAFNMNGVVRTRLFLEAQYSGRRYSSSLGDAFDSDPIRGTVILDPSRGSFAGYNSAQGVSAQPELFDNDSYSLKGVYFLPTSEAGTHEIHSGYERFSESARTNLHHSGSDFWIDRSTGIMRGTSIFPTFRPGQVRIEWFPILQASLGSNLVTDSGYLEDRIQLGRRWNLNLGVRYDRNRDRDSRSELVSSSGAWSPRLSLQFDPRGDGRWELHGTYARYVDKLQDNIANAASPAGTAALTWLYQGPCVNCNPLAPTSALVPADQALRTLFDWFNGVGGTASTPTLGAVVPGVSARIAPGLIPQSAREYAAGAGAALGSRGFVRADFIRRDYLDLYSDRIDLSTGQSAPAFGSVHDLAIIGNSAKQTRRYTAVQTHFSWRFAESVQAAGSYTWSRLTGNSRGEGATSATLSNIDQYPEYKQESWNFPTGYLSARGQTQAAVDQRHRARTWVVYRVPARWGDLTAAVLESYDSGLPYEAVGFLDPRAYVANPGYAEPPSTVMYFFTKPGSFRTDDITRTDLALTCAIHLLRDVELFVRPEVLNLFNEKGVVSVDTTVLTAQNSNEQFRRFNPFTEKPVRGVNYDLGPTFGQPTGASDYQQPRTFRISVGVRF